MHRLCRRFAVDHRIEFLKARLGTFKTSTPFLYSGPLTQTVLLGGVALRFLNELLSWDTKGFTFGRLTPTRCCDASTASVGRLRDCDVDGGAAECVSHLARRQPTMANNDTASGTLNSADRAIEGGPIMERTMDRKTFLSAAIMGGAAAVALRPREAKASDALPAHLDSSPSAPYQTFQEPNVFNKEVMFKGGPWLDAKAYGAKGDNVTDDTAALQAWLDDCKLKNKSGYLPNGNYKITSTLSLTGGTTVFGWRIFGESMTMIGSGGTRIFWAGAAGGTMLLLQGVSTGTMSFLTLDGMDLAGVGLDLDAVTGTFSTWNEFQRCCFMNCKEAGVTIGKSHVQTDQTNWIDCAFYLCRSANPQVAGSGTSCGVKILDANSLWNQFRGCAWQRCDIGISSVETGSNGGHFGLTGCKFNGQSVVDIKPHSVRGCSISDTQSEWSYRFLVGAGGSSADGVVTLNGCSVTVVDAPDGKGIIWNRPSPLVILGGSYGSIVRGRPKFLVQVGNQVSKGTCIAKGALFIDGNPWAAAANLQLAHIDAEGCVYGYTVGDAGTGTLDVVPANDGAVPYRTPSTPITLHATAADAVQTFWADVVWVNIPSGTALMAGATVFYLKNRNCNGYTRPQLETLHSVGGADAVFLGVHGIDDDAVNPNIAKIFVRCASAVTLTSDMVFALRFRNEPVAL